MTRSNPRKLAVLFLATAAAAGCGAEELLDGEETISEGGPDSIQVIQQGLTVNRRLHTIKSITTNGKRMTLGVWECWNETKVAHPVVGCWVDSDYVVVGGSGGIDTGSPGALLTASYPDTSLSAWTVESKDHGEPYPHFLHAFAHGIKIDGMEPRDLRQHMNVVIRTSSPATAHPRLSASAVPSDRWLVTTGAKLNYGSGPGNMLVGAWNTNVSGKDHGWSSPATITSYEVYILKSLPIGTSEVKFKSATSPEVTSGLAYAGGMKPDAGFVEVAPFAYSVYYHPGRMLIQYGYTTGRAPSLGYEARAKDHLWPARGSVLNGMSMMRVK